MRGLDHESRSKTLLIGVSSSGYSKNICLALDHALEMDCKAALISAQTPKIAGKYNTVELSVDEYHTSEVFTLALIYQLIHSGGFECPPIPTASTSSKVLDYSVR